MSDYSAGILVSFGEQEQHFQLVSNVVILSGHGAGKEEAEGKDTQIVRLDMLQPVGELGRFIRVDHHWEYEHIDSTWDVFVGEEQLGQSRLRMEEGQIIRFQHRDSRNIQEEEMVILFYFGLFQAKYGRVGVSEPEDNGEKEISYSVGSGEDCELSLDTASLREEHGWFVYKRQEWYFRRKDSKSDLYINGRPMKGAGDVPVRNLDVLKIGNISFVRIGRVLYYTRPEILEDIYLEPDLFLDEKEPDPEIEARKPAESWWSPEMDIPSLSAETRQESTNNKKRLNTDSAVPMMSGGPLMGNQIRVTGLTKIGGWRQKTTRLDDVYALIPKGALVAILGGSGAGKSTFIKCVMGYTMPSEGRVEIDGIDLYKNLKRVRSRMGYVPQDDLLREDLTVRETLLGAGRLRLSCPERELERRMNRLLQQLEIDSGATNRRIRNLSGGQRKRVSIACELLSDPQLIFLDEPTSGLDPRLESEMVQLFRRLCYRNRKTLIVSTHTLASIGMFDLVMFFAPGGKLCYLGEPWKAAEYFGVESFTDIYEKLEGDVAKYVRRCRIENGGRG